MKAGPEIVLALLAVLIVLWLLARQGRKASAAVEPKAPLPLQPPAISIVVTSPVDKEKFEVEKAEAIFQQLHLREAERHRDRHRGLEEVRRTIAKADKYCEKSGLKTLVPEVWECVRCWPSWINRAQSWTLPLDITDVSGEGDKKKAWVCWTWQGSKFRLDFAEQYTVFNDGETPSKITLHINDQHAVTLCCAQGYESHGRWRCSLVEALTVGPWMSDFVHFASELRLESTASLDKSSDDFERARASRMDLGL